MSSVRPFREEDIEEVVLLRMNTFDSPSEQISVDEMPLHFQEAFLKEGGSPDISSLVFEDAQGRVRGFLGILSRRMQFKGKSLVMSVGTRLMADPDYPGLVGLSLMRHHFNGPQDLTFSDMLNEPGRQMFQLLGGEVGSCQTLEWVYANRPVRHWLAEGRGVARYRGFRGFVRPIANVIDGMKRLPPPRRSVRARHFTFRELPDLIDRVMARRTLRPSYSPRDLEHLSSLVNRRRFEGTIKQAVLETDGNEIVGWYIYLLNCNHQSRVIQMGWAKGWEEEVLICLLEDASEHGSRAIRGDLDCELLPTLRRLRARIEFQNRWTMFMTKNPELAHSIHAGNAMISRLEGEWPTSYF